MPRSEEESLSWEQTSSTLEIEAVLHKADFGLQLEESDLWILLRASGEPGRIELIESTANRVKEKICGRVVGLIIPQYLTSYCQNECLYCAYRVGNVEAPRKRLAMSEFERELQRILEWGYREIELVLADDPEFPPERLAEYVRVARRRLDRAGGGRVAINAPAYQSAQYHRLARAGVDWVALWQETYDEEQFSRWHPVPSPKAHYRFRLDALERALRAGIPQIALGILFGLSDWRWEVLRLIEQCRYLESQYGIRPYALGIPRLKPALGSPASGKPSRFTLSDLEYRLAVAILKLVAPHSRLFFTTREPLALNWQLLCGGNLFTLDCSTVPGGYLEEVGEGQFAVQSYGERKSLLQAFRGAGYTIEGFAGA